MKITFENFSHPYREKTCKEHTCITCIHYEYKKETCTECWKHNKCYWNLKKEKDEIR